MTPEKEAKRHPRCPKVPAHGLLAYFAQFDAYACTQCNEWKQDSKCDDPDCEYCVPRPESPSDLVGP